LAGHCAALAALTGDIKRFAELAHSVCTLINGVFNLAIGNASTQTNVHKILD
jgi:hypothetical protein